MNSTSRTYCSYARATHAVARWLKDSCVNWAVTDSRPAVRGTEPAERVHPMAIEVMGEKDIDISHAEPKSVGDYLGRLPVRHLIVVCDGANEKCPRVFPGMMNRMFWPFDDPAAFVGDSEATMEEFRRVRDQIETRIKQWLEETP